MRDAKRKDLSTGKKIHRMLALTNTIRFKAAAICTADCGTREKVAEHCWPLPHGTRLAAQ
jgi:hypothetical protein